ncbi:Uncharacterized protein HZ326_27761 [Fusarium oxysporum f. sp. albedinis]|nr:Uncharacterized protein HZ326_27761 [Fusarium oxysporum f. sp. albedinis]
MKRTLTRITGGAWSRRELSVNHWLTWLIHKVISWPQSANGNYWPSEYDVSDSSFLLSYWQSLILFGFVAYIEFVDASASYEEPFQLSRFQCRVRDFNTISRTKSINYSFINHSISIYRGYLYAFPLIRYRIAPERLKYRSSECGLCR